MAAPGKFKTYDFLSKYMGDTGGIDFDTAAIKFAFFLSTSNANTLGVGTGVFGDLTNEHAVSGGYVAGGFAVPTPTWVRAGSVLTLDAPDLILGTPSANWVARFGVLYFTGTLGGIVKPLIAVSLLDTAPADVTFPTGNPAEIRFAAGGILTLTGATVD